MRVWLRTGLIVLIISLTLAELISRLYISIVFSTPLWHPSGVIYTFYPELHTLPSKLDTTKINILILGGSAVTDTLCHTTSKLERELSQAGFKVRVYNLSRFAHTSLDSKIKFKHCRNLPFDYIFVYDGINDTRANNCPDYIFREDYSHIHFYGQVDIFERHPEINYFSLPFVLDYCWNEFRIKIGWKKTIPKEYCVINPRVVWKSGNMKGDLRLKQFLSKYRDKIVGSDLLIVDSLWWKEGNEIKSAKSFRNNLQFIYRSKSGSTNVILTDYAWYLPINYSLNEFLYGKLDYDEQRWPTELYGDPKNVVKGLKCHNRIIDSIAIEHPDIIHFNMNDSMPHNGKYFNDICHLADSGQILLCHILANQIIQKIKIREKILSVR